MDGGWGRRGRGSKSRVTAAGGLEVGQLWKRDGMRGRKQSSNINWSVEGRDGDGGGGDMYCIWLDWT